MTKGDNMKNIERIQVGHTYTYTEFCELLELKQYQKITSSSAIAQLKNIERYYQLEVTKVGNKKAWYVVEKREQPLPEIKRGKKRSSMTIKVSENEYKRAVELISELLDEKGIKYEFIERERS